MAGKDDDRDDSELWSDKFFQSLKAEHDRLFNHLHTESKRLERELSRDDNDNSRAGPFSAFKKFIDNGISSITSTLQDLPSNTNELKSRMNSADQDRLRAEEQDISQRWTGCSDSPDHIQLQNSRSSAQEKEEAVDSAAELLEMAQMHNLDVPPEMIEALYRDPEAHLGTLDTLGGRSSLPQPHWLSVNWFKRSPYSPVRLEAHPDMGQHGAKWRAAFEDLLNASLDKPMDSFDRVGMRVPHGRPQSTYYGPGLEWMLSLQCRGILPPQLPRTYSAAHAASELRHSWVTDLLEEKDLFGQGGSPLQADFEDLVSEVGTKATADTEAEPLPVRVTPETELDLYQSPCLFPAEWKHDNECHKSCGQDQLPSGGHQTVRIGATAIDEPQVLYSDSPYQSPRLEKLDHGRLNPTEQKNVQLLNATNIALSGSDIKEAADLLTALHERGLDIDSVWFDRQDKKKLHDRLVFFAEALRASKIPSHSIVHSMLENKFSEEADRWTYALKSKDPDALEKFDEEFAGLLMRRHKLLNPDLSDLAPGIPSLNKLREEVERLEQEYDNIEQMTGGKDSRLDRALQEYEMRTQSNTQMSVAKEEVHASQQTIAPSESKILSALTTTHTTRLPDGTVTTKVVLKQRFADGREETTESSHTSNEKQYVEARAEEREKPKNNGWFWS